MDIRDEVKIMLFSKGMTLTQLAKKMSEASGKNYSQSLLSHKLADNSLRYTEMKMICKILVTEYTLTFEEIRLGQ